MSKPYNGHHCRNCWNVALWIGNEEPLYRAALECLNRPRMNGKPASKRLAAVRFLREVVGQDARTPDGARYTLKAVQSALAGLES
jgi:hypothetical protein